MSVCGAYTFHIPSTVTTYSKGVFACTINPQPPILGSPSDVDHNCYYVNPADAYHGEFTGGGRNSAGWGDNGSTSDGLFYFTYRRYPVNDESYCEGSQSDHSLVIFGRSFQSLWVLVGTY